MNNSYKNFKKTLGKIISIKDIIIIASGLSSSFLGEVVKFKIPGSELIGQLLNFKKNLIIFIIIKASLLYIIIITTIHYNITNLTNYKINCEKN